MAQFVRNTVAGGNFETPDRYTKPKVLKIGVTGIVCSSWDQIRQQYVAVKKIPEPFRTPSTTQYILREIKLLKHLQHENIVRPLDLFISPTEDIYLVTDFMQTDLRTVMNTKPISHEFVQFFLYQIMRGLKYVHSAGVIHRDLKPENILINEDCDLKICDFGLTRVQELQMTSYVSTGYYRAPEVMLTWQRYGEQIDIWSAGCIFAEMLLGKPLFAERGHVEQFCAITELLGTPDEGFLARIASKSTLNLIRSFPQRQARGVSSVFSDVDPKALDLLERMLVFDPYGRISASNALTAPYLVSYHDPTDEPVAKDTFDETFDGCYCSHDSWKRKLYAEVLEYHKQSETQDSVRKWAHSVSKAQN
jgi:p38 MAP kinase